MNVFSSKDWRLRSSPQTFLNSCSYFSIINHCFIHIVTWCVWSISVCDSSLNIFVVSYIYFGSIYLIHVLNFLSLNAKGMSHEWAHHVVIPWGRSPQCRKSSDIFMLMVSYQCVMCVSKLHIFHSSYLLNTNNINMSKQINYCNDVETWLLYPCLGWWQWYNLLHVWCA